MPTCSVTCVYGGCPDYSYICVCDSGWEGLSCNQQSEAKLLGLNMNVAITIIILVIIAAGYAIGAILLFIYHSSRRRSQFRRVAQQPLKPHTLQVIQRLAARQEVILFEGEGARSLFQSTTTCHAPYYKISNLIMQFEDGDCCHSETNIMDTCKTTYLYLSTSWTDRLCSGLDKEQRNGTVVIYSVDATHQIKNFYLPQARLVFDQLVDHILAGWDTVPSKLIYDGKGHRPLGSCKTHHWTIYSTHVIHSHSTDCCSDEITEAISLLHIEDMKMTNNCLHGGVILLYDCTNTPFLYISLSSNAETRRVFNELLEIRKQRMLAAANLQQLVPVSPVFVPTAAPTNSPIQLNVNVTSPTMNNNSNVQNSNGFSPQRPSAPLISPEQVTMFDYDEKSIELQKMKQKIIDAEYELAAKQLQKLEKKLSKHKDSNATKAYPEEGTYTEVPIVDEQ